jgi:hypothetical protein
MVRLPPPIAGCRHRSKRNREEATGTLKTRPVEDIPSIISIDGALIIVITLSGCPQCDRDDVPGWKRLAK